MRPLIRAGEGLDGYKRLAREHHEFRSRLEQALATPVESTTPTRATAGGDSRRLRGIPAIGRGVQGALPGSKPGEGLRDKPLRIGHKVALFQLLVQRDGPGCYLCGGQFHESDLQIEHIIPKDRGGTDDASNIALACSPCNSRKGTKTVVFDIATRRPLYNARQYPYCFKRRQ